MYLEVREATERPEAGTSALHGLLVLLVERACALTGAQSAELVPVGETYSGLADKITSGSEGISSTGPGGRLEAPLRAGDEVYGILRLSNKEGGGAFSPEDEATLAQLTAFAAWTLDSAQRLQGQRRREEFIAIVAHDLRNPIQSMLLQLERFLRKAKGAEDVDVPVSALRSLVESGNRMKRLVADLLDASRIEHHRVRLELTSFDLGELVRGLMAQMAPSLEEHPIEPSLVTGEAVRVRADRDRIEQVLTNLLDNAAKYSPPGAPIALHVTPMEAGVEVSVTDHGKGIAPDALPHLFEREYQVMGLRENRTGLGLGLYISKGLVDAHGGRLTVETELGKGSTFHLWLPREGPPA